MSLRSQASSTSNSVSTTYGKDVTTRSVAKVTQEVSQQQRLDIINSFKETVEHGFDNTNGAENISGVYQYVDALYEVGVFNYGRRLLLDLVVPNPGAFIRDAIKVANGGAVTAYNPPPISFTPSNLTVPQSLLPVIPAGQPNAGQPDNYYPAIGQWAAVDPNSGVSPSVDYTIQAQIYQVQGLKAPPDPFLVVTKQYNATSTTTTGAGDIPLVSDYLQIPEGYQATSATVVAAISAMPAGNIPGQTNGYNLSVTLGGTFLQWGAGIWAPDSLAIAVNSGNPAVLSIGSGVVQTVSGLSERGSLAITVSGGVILTYVVAIEVTCVMTNEAFAQWQLDTFTLINQAFLALLSTYQGSTSQNQQSLAGTNYPGSSPAENTRVVQTELKREVISMITLQQFDPPTLASAYAVGTAYPAGAVASYNGVAYVSLVGNNKGHQPDINATWWSTTIQQFDSPAAGVPYNPGTQYDAGAVVSYPIATPGARGLAYVSLQGGNQGNQPDINPNWWAMNTDTYVDPNLPAWSGQGSSSTRSAINFPVLFQQGPLIRFMEEGFEWDQMHVHFLSVLLESKKSMV